MIFTQEACDKIKAATNIQLMPGLSIHGEGILAAPCLIYPGPGIFTSSSLGGYSYLVPPFETTFLEIGNYCSIARGLIVGLGHPVDLLTASPVAWRPWLEGHDFPGKTNYDYLPTRIGSDVWIGANVIIKAGCTIGDGCFIGAGSVVTKDIPPYTIAVGNPCKVIRPRFDNFLRERIHELRWFDYDWSGIHVDWSKPTASIEGMEKTLLGSPPPGFQQFRYQASADNMNLQKIP